ncbi:hypothetical protein [Nocardia higoensis]|uniref:hypothetical protein n=1 Tax=Nocardia higoensis TaxID=228599 RepID=UPI0003020F6C|nr:hypothetical protein [Nocardia higoensis]
MNFTMKRAPGVALGAAAGFTAYDLWSRARDDMWPTDAGTWLTVVLAAVVVGTVTAIVYRLVLGLRGRRARRGTPGS